MAIAEAPFRAPRELRNKRSAGDRIFRGGVRGGAMLTLVLMGLIGLFLAVESWPAISSVGGRFFTTLVWNPEAKPADFGIASVIYGTFLIATIALVIAVPISVLSALFINEFAPRPLQRILIGLVDLLAAIPSLIYGLWGRAALQGQLSGFAKFISDHFGFIPLFKVTNARYTSSPFIAGVVVSLMVLPIATAVIREVFSRAPAVEKEGALALGATRWGMIRTVILPFGRGGIIGGSMLGLGRALGETIAVTLIISPVYTISPRILELGGNSVASLIALKFSDASIFGRRALIAAGLTLFVVTLIVNMLASLIVSRSRSGKGVDA